MLILNQAVEEYTAINIITRYPNWLAGSTYNFGDIIFENHYYYKSVIDNNTGNSPSTNKNYNSLWCNF